MNFEQFGLDARILAGVKAAGYETPTPIQQQAIPVVLEGKDILGLAQTGTGKTAAFALPILQRLTQGPLRKVRTLILAPTRELAEQIHQSFYDLGKNTKIRSTAIYGGVGKYGQINELRRGAEIVVACPGRLLDHIGDRSIDLSQIEILVLDEADRMCDMGFLPDIRRILKVLPKQRQTLFFSATMPDDIRQLSGEMLNSPVTVQIGVSEPVKTVSHALYPVTDGLKTKLLMSWLEQTATGRVIVFTRTKRRARNLAADLEQKRYRVSALQGNMAQNRRQESINGFRDGKYDILVATDIAARGIDVTEVTHVINFDMPDTTDAYTHRIGRTGRAEQTGEAFTFATPADLDTVRDVEKVLGKKIERRRLQEFDYAGFSPENYGGLAGTNGQQPARSQQSGQGQQHRQPQRSQPQRSQPQRSQYQSGQPQASQRQPMRQQPDQRRADEQQRSDEPRRSDSRQQEARTFEPRTTEHRPVEQRPSEQRPIEQRPIEQRQTERRGGSVQSQSSTQRQPVAASRQPAPAARPSSGYSRSASESDQSASNGSAPRRIWRRRSVTNDS